MIPIIFKKEVTNLYNSRAETEHNLTHGRLRCMLACTSEANSLTQGNIYKKAECSGSGLAVDQFWSRIYVVQGN